MTMMSRNSSDSSLDDEQESTVSSKSGPRKSLGSFISQSSSSRRTRADKDSTSDDCSDMPSLSSFRLEDMSASVASRGSSYASTRGECDISLPSLSSFRMDEMSLASSYHSGTNHMSEESAEGWSSFTSGNASADTDSDDEFANASSSDPSRGGGRRPSSPSVEHGGSIDGGGRKSSTSNGRSKSRNAAKSGILKSRAPVETIHGTGTSIDCNLTSNARPPRRRSPETEADMNSSLPMRRPRRTLSPTTPNQHDSTRVDDDHDDDEVEIDDLEQKRPASPTEDQISRPPTRPLSPDRTPVERTESLPLSILQPPTRTAQGDSSSSVRLSGDSSSTLRGGDSLPRLPRRTSTMDDRSTHAEEDVGDDDTKLSMEGSRVSDDVTEISDGSIDSDLSDDDSSITRNSSSMPLHEINKLTDKEATNTHHEGQLIDGINSIKIHSVVVRGSENQTITAAEDRTDQQDRPVSQPIQRPLDPGKDEQSPKRKGGIIGESATNRFGGRETTAQTDGKVHSGESTIDQATNEDSGDSISEPSLRQQKMVDDEKVPIRLKHHATDNRDEDMKRTADRENKTDPESTSNNTTDPTEETKTPADETNTSAIIDPLTAETSDDIPQSRNEDTNDQHEKIDDKSSEENGAEAAAVDAGNESDGKGPVRNRKSPTSVRELEGSLPPKPATASASPKATNDDGDSNNEKSTPEESGVTSAEESGTTSSETEVEDSSEDAKNGGGKKKEVSKRGLLRKMSNSFKQIGKSTSFRNSFRMIGKTASKIKQMGKREDDS